MTPEKARDVLQSVTFRDHEFLIVEHGENEFSLQVAFTSPDDGEECKTRKWRISQYMTASELVQTALKAALTSAEHQVREFFYYRDRAIFGPHFDVEALYEICVPDCMEVR